MTDKRFSRPDQGPTEFEAELLQAADADASPWVRLGQLIGATALCTVLAELGGEQVHVPVRRDFFPRLHRIQRDAQIRAMVATNTMSSTEIAKRVGGVSAARVRQMRMQPGRSRRKHRRVASNRDT